MSSWDDKSFRWLSRILMVCDEATTSYHVTGTKQDRRAQLAREGRERALQAKYRSHRGKKWRQTSSLLHAGTKSAGVQAHLAPSSEM
jgi:hypothetical protein